MAEWLLEPVQADSHVNRYLHGVWESRPDLRQWFPVPLGANSTELINWSWLNQSSDADIVAELLPPKESPARIPVIVSDQPGVNLAGYFLAGARRRADGAAAGRCGQGVRTAVLDGRQPPDLQPPAGPVHRGDHAGALPDQHLRGQR